MTRYPTVEETVAVHAKLIEQSGGSGGVRDHAALESALARPQSRYYSDLIQEAAAFLRVNGYRMEFNDADALSFLLDLYETNRMTSPELDRCLRQHVVPFDPTAWMDLDQFRCCSPQRQMQRCADARVF